MWWGERKKMRFWWSIVGHHNIFFALLSEILHLAVQKQENARQEIHMDTPKYCFVCSVVSDSMTVLPFCIHQQTFLVFLKLRPGNKRLELIFFFFHCIHLFILAFWSILGLFWNWEICLHSPQRLLFAVFTSLGYIDIVTKEDLAFSSPGGSSNILYTSKIWTYKYYSKKAFLKFFAFKPLKITKY